MDIVINAAIDEVPKGSVSISCQHNFYHHILSLLGYPNENPPVADWLRQYHGLEGQWLIASPIHWQATHNDAMMVASGHELQLTDLESRLWFTAFREFLAPENIAVYYHDAHTWLLQCENKPPITAKSPAILLHQSMMPELQKLDQTLFWQRFITENQMFFSTHPLNKERQGLLSINGVWLWGTGQLNERVQTQLVCAGTDLVKLAKLLSTNVRVYDPSTPFVKKSMLLFNELSEHDHQVLQTQLQKKTVQWYWNNVAYTTKKPKRWFQK